MIFFEKLTSGVLRTENIKYKNFTKDKNNWGIQMKKGMKKSVFNNYIKLLVAMLFMVLMINVTNTTFASTNSDIELAAATQGGASNYTLTNDEVKFKIIQKDIKSGNLTVTPDSFVYDGTSKSPTSSELIVDGRTLKYGTDYTIEYTDNVNVGQATATATGLGNYTGTLATYYTINKANFDASVKITGTNRIGETLIATPTVSIEGCTYKYTWYSNSENSMNGGSIIQDESESNTYIVKNGLVGNYIYVKLEVSKDNYESKIVYDITDANENNVAQVGKKQLTKPTFSGTFTYTGSEQKLAVSGYDESTMSITGNTGINAGDYTANVTLRDTENTEWKDGGTVSYKWKIAKMAIQTPWDDKSSFVYSGAEQGPTLTSTTIKLENGETLNLEVTGYNINVGTGYVATARIASVTDGQRRVENYELTNASKIYSIVNAKLVGTLTIEGRNVYGETLTANVTTTPSDTDSIEYQWYYSYADDMTSGTQILGATDITYKIGDCGVSKEELINKYIYVVVTVNKTNYDNLTLKDVTDAENNSYATVVEPNYKDNNENVYMTLQEAFSNAISGSTVTVLKDVTESRNAKIILGANKTIILNLNNNTITLDGQNTHDIHWGFIKVNGNLTIDGIGTIKTIEGNENIASIINVENGTLNINKDVVIERTIASKQFIC